MSELSPTRRCGECHESWAELTEQLSGEFPQVPAEMVGELISAVVQAERRFGLPETERLAAAAVMVRRQLSRLSGQQPSGTQLVLFVGGTLDQEIATLTNFHESMWLRYDDRMKPGEWYRPEAPARYVATDQGCARVMQLTSETP